MADGRKYLFLDVDGVYFLGTLEDAMKEDWVVDAAGRGELKVFSESLEEVEVSLETKITLG